MATQQALIVGLGQFGMALARSLARHGTEVIAVDRRSERVQIASAFATEAVAIDAMDEVELARLRPRARDLCVCAIGDENREASIIVTATLRQMGAQRLVARATDGTHERILRLVGATEVLNPERMLGERLAARFAYPGVIDVVPLGDDLIITELRPPASSIGRTLAQLHLQRNYQLTLLAVRRRGEARDRTILPSAELKILEGDVLVLVGPDGAARRFSEAS